jgi:hypothetical protein
LARLFFDRRDGETLIQGDEGFEYPDLDAVEAEAARALAELARDVLPSSLQRELAIEVRDEQGPVLRAIMTFEAITLRPA